MGVTLKRCSDGSVTELKGESSFLWVEGEHHRAVRDICICGYTDIP